MLYIWSYVHEIEVVGMYLSIHSDDRARPLQSKWVSSYYEDRGLHKFSKFTVKLYVNRHIAPPRGGWNDIAFVLGTWYAQGEGQ